MSLLNAWLDSIVAVINGEKKKTKIFPFRFDFFQYFECVCDFFIRNSHRIHIDKSKQFNIRLNFSHQLFNDWMLRSPFLHPPLLLYRWIAASYRYNNVLIRIHHTKPHIKTRKINFIDADKAKALHSKKNLNKCQSQWHCNCTRVVHILWFGMEISEFIRFYHMPIVNGFIVDLVAVASVAAVVTLLQYFCTSPFESTKCGKKRTTGNMVSNKWI